jgi:hypothetical protein
VKPGEVKKAVPLSVHAAADGGKRRELLVALRSRIAKDIDNPNTPARDVAALSRRLLEIAKDLEALDVEDEQEGGGRGPAADKDFNASAI